MFKFKTKIEGRTRNDGTKNFKIRVSVRNLNIFGGTLEMPLINCKIILILTWSNICFIIDDPIASQEPTLTITDTKFYVPVVTLSTQDNTKLLEQLNQVLKIN